MRDINARWTLTETAHTIVQSELVDDPMTEDNSYQNMPQNPVFFLSFCGFCWSICKNHVHMSNPGQKSRDADFPVNPGAAGLCAVKPHPMPRFTPVSRHTHASTHQPIQRL